VGLQRNFLGKSFVAKIQNQLLIERDVGYLSKEKFEEIARHQ
jgi:hypothetical protein